MFTNLEAKVTSTKQVSEAGNCHMPQRALKENNPRLHCFLQSFILMQGLAQYFKNMILMADEIHFLPTAYSTQYK